MLDEKGEVIYVGKAKDLKKRVSSYFSKTYYKIQKPLSWLNKSIDIDFTITHSENEAFCLNVISLKNIRPRYNILFRDDKSYPYILITNQHTYPRIDIYRGQRKKNGLYFGPYPSSSAVTRNHQFIAKNYFVFALVVIVILMHVHDLVCFIKLVAAQVLVWN